MIDIEEVDIFVLDVLSNKKFLFQVPIKIKSLDLKKKLLSLLSTNNLEFRHHSKLYPDDQIITFEQGDTIYVYKKEENEKNNKQETYVGGGGMNLEKLGGVFKLCLVKYISDKIIDVNIIKNEKLKKIIDEMKSFLLISKDENKNIKINVKNGIEINIISYAYYISSEISDNDISNLINIFDQIYVNDIFHFWETLTIYQKYINFFDEILPKAIKNSYFEYSLSGIQLLNPLNNKDYFIHFENCPNREIKYLFQEIQGGQKNTKKQFFGLGTYFTDKIDYISYYQEKQNVKESFSCNISQIYYNKNLKQNIKDYSYYTHDSSQTNKKVIKNGIHIIKVKADSRQIINEQDLNKEKLNGNFIANEYVISEKEQILPLFNLDFNKNQDLIIWRDPSYNTNTPYENMFKYSKLFIYENYKMNLYFENSLEKAFELVKRKKFNKIILISNIGKDLSGKRFVEISRKILGFPIIILFFSNNSTHLSWLKDFPNVLFTNNKNIIQQYIINYNEKGLLSLKNEIEKTNNIKLKFTNDFFSYKNIIKNNNYKNIIFEEINPHFRKVTIKNIKTSNLLCMNYLGNIIFLPQKKINDNYSYIWYITILDDEITFYNNQFYLGINPKEKKVVKEEFMKKWKFNIIEKTSYYFFYYENESNILTENNNQALVQIQIDKHYYNQLFVISDKIEDID